MEILELLQAEKVEEFNEKRSYRSAPDLFAVGSAPGPRAAVRADEGGVGDVLVLNNFDLPGRV